MKNVFFVVRALLASLATVEPDEFEEKKRKTWFCILLLAAVRFTAAAT